MKTFKNRGLLLGIGILGASALTGLTTSASADPRDRDVRESHKDVVDARQEVRHDQRDLHRADTPQERGEARRELRDDKGDLQRQKREFHQNVREDVRHDHYAPRPVYIQRRPVYVAPSRPVYVTPPRPIYQGHPVVHNWSNNGGHNYIGKVTDVHSNTSFDVNIGGNTFNVYTNNRVPLGLSRGDIVRINGEQKYNNDIRDARASIVHNG